MKKVWYTLVQHGFTIMISGFILAVIALVPFMKFRSQAGLLRSTFLVIVITGFVIYGIGRLLVIIKRRQKDPAPSSGDDQQL